MGTVKKTRKKKPSAAQLRARKRFVAMVRARAKAAKAKKKATKKATAKRRPAIKRTVKRAATKKRARVTVTVKNGHYKVGDRVLTKYGKGKIADIESDGRYLIRFEATGEVDALYGGIIKKLPKLKRKTNPRRGTRKLTASRRASEKFLRTMTNRKSAKALSAAEKREAIRELRSKRKANGGATLARKRRQEFVGRPSKKTLSMYAPKGSGASGTVVAMGKLKKLHIKGRTPLDFKGSALLAHNPKTDQMYILGRNYSLKHLRKNPSTSGLEDIGEVTRIEYEATKTHLGDKGPVTYYHRLGEEGGKRPHALINEENLLILEGGDYYIRPEGIRN